MFIPIVVPSYSRSSSSCRPTIINKTIIYQDTVLDLKDKGGSLRVTKIKVKIEKFEECLNTIFESNPEVIFNTVQYSHKNEEAIFYTNSEISTEKWEKRDERLLDPVLQSVTLVDAVKAVLIYEDVLQQDCISAFSVWKIYKEVCSREYSLRKQIKDIIDSKLKTINEKFFSFLNSFDYDKNEIKVSIHTKNYQEFYFRKNQGDLYIHKQDGYVGFDVLSLIGTEIEKYYDYCYPKREIWDQYIYGVKSINSVFYCDFSEAAVQIDNCPEIWRETFSVEAFANDDKFTVECNSNNIHKILNGNENLFVKNIFVKISDCPEWMQEKLYEIRRQEIEHIQNERIAKERAEKEKAEQERIIKEKLERELAKKQKRCEFLKKIFPFIK